MNTIKKWRSYQIYVRIKWKMFFLWIYFFFPYADINIFHIPPKKGKLHSCLWKLKIKIWKMISYILKICFTNFKKKQFYYSWKIWRENSFYLCTNQKRKNISATYVFYYLLIFYFIFYISVNATQLYKKVRLNIKTAYRENNIKEYIWKVFIFPKLK